MAGCVRLLLVLSSALALARGESKRRFTIYETVERIVLNGYLAERHYVTTEDGYIVEMQRITRGRNETLLVDLIQKPVVFLMHGLLASSNVFITNGPKYSMGYTLADAGFEVWMGNARGNRLSRNHTCLDPDAQKRQFFDITYEDIAIKDLPAMINYALDTSGQDKLHYIGHSQGGSVFMVLNSLWPEFNDKFKSAHLLAPVGYQNYFSNSFIRAAASRSDVIYATFFALGIVEVFPPRTKLSNIVCGDDDSVIDLCLLDRITQQLGKKSVFDPSSDEFTAGAALKQLVHFGQNIRDKAFRRYDYGTAANYLKYGQRDPPDYGLSLITTNVTIHYALKDSLVDRRDIYALPLVIPNSRLRKVARDDFTHQDFTAAKDSQELVTDFIIKDLRSVEEADENSDACEISEANQGNKKIDLHNCKEKN